ncbi:hypothetical protein MFIFM68171_02148 [Madurella fahalii]|uniref:JmjC domain-containing protein n=1 Tax=Madurella fahalii TaxID=1157608 RepID=A0ABQ0G2E9_9PEZI
MGTTGTFQGLESAEFDEIIGALENLVTQLKQAKAVARTLTRLSNVPHSDPIFNSLRSILAEATRLISVHSSSAAAETLEGEHENRDAASSGDTLVSEQAHVPEPAVLETTVVERNATEPSVPQAIAEPRPAEAGTQNLNTLEPAITKRSIAEPGAMESTVLEPGILQPNLVEPSIVEPAVAALPGPTTETPPINVPPQLLRRSGVALDAVGHEFNDGVLVLRPSAEQWLDFPAVLASARSLGAERVGAFKVRLPPELQQTLPNREAQVRAKPCRGYRIKALPNGTYSVNMPPGRQVFRHSHPCSLSAREAVQRHEAMFSSDDGLSDIYYRTDVPAETPEQRAAAGLPERSTIWPLAGNGLSRTKYSIPGLHWPYAYESGPKFGATFADHHEDYGLHSINHLHVGRKLWRVVPPSAADALVKKLKETDDTIIWDCDQCVRHAGIFVPSLTLSRWGIPFTIVDQEASELVVTMPRAYHSGFSAGYTLAEAVNYADAGWTSYHCAACAPSCPKNSIPADLLLFLSPGETQRRMEGSEKEELKRAKRSKRRRRLSSSAEHGGETNAEGGPTIDEPATDEDGVEGMDLGRPTKMPILSLEPNERIVQVMNHILTHDFPPEWLNCTDRGESFEARLEQFLPGGLLDGQVLVKLLQILCKGSGLFVQQPSNAETRHWRLDQNLHNGLVVPMQVDSCSRMPISMTQHGWGVAVVDWKHDKFISVDLDDGLAKRWKTQFESQLKGQLHHDSQKARPPLFCLYSQ